MLVVLSLRCKNGSVIVVVLLGFLLLSSFLYLLYNSEAKPTAKRGILRVQTVFLKISINTIIIGCPPSHSGRCMPTSGVWSCHVAGEMCGSVHKLDCLCLALSEVSSRNVLSSSQSGLFFCLRCQKLAAEMRYQVHNVDCLFACVVRS